MTFIAFIDQDIPERSHKITEENWITTSNFGPGTRVIGFNGKVYENYGTKDKPLWIEVFDAQYVLTVQL